MSKIRMLNNLTGQYFEVEAAEPAPLPKPTEAEQKVAYDARVSDLIREQYSSSREDGVKSDGMEDIAQGVPLRESVLAFYEYKDQCKDKAHLEVYGYARG